MILEGPRIMLQEYDQTKKQIRVGIQLKSFNLGHLSFLMIFEGPITKLQEYARKYN